MEGASSLPGRIWLIGAGNMGGAMLRRWIGSGIAPAEILVIDPGAPQLPEGVRHAAGVPEGEAAPDTLVLAVKPQKLDDFVGDPDNGAALAPRLLVSILAGVEVAALAARFRAEAIVRAMPNLPVSIGKGVVALYSDAGPQARAAAEGLTRPLGLVEWIGEERLFDAVTALSGCGPGFVYRFIDAMAEAGAQLGLPADQALRLAVATVEGSGLLAAASGESPAVLADRVASPGGSTRAGLNVLDEGGAIKTLLLATLTAAERRNAEMAAEARRS